MNHNVEKQKCSQGERQVTDSDIISGAYKLYGITALQGVSNRRKCPVSCVCDCERSCELVHKVICLFTITIINSELIFKAFEHSTISYCLEAEKDIWKGKGQNCAFPRAGRVP